MKNIIAMELCINIDKYKFNNYKLIRSSYDEILHKGKLFKYKGYKFCIYTYKENGGIITVAFEISSGMNIFSKRYESPKFHFAKNEAMFLVDNNYIEKMIQNLINI